MAASREEVDNWIERAKNDKFEFIISACDTFDWEDYPVFRGLKLMPDFIYLAEFAELFFIK
jgi:hypothetical protein